MYIILFLITNTLTSKTVKGLRTLNWTSNRKTNRSNPTQDFSYLNSIVKRYMYVESRYFREDDIMIYVAKYDFALTGVGE